MERKQVSLDLGTPALQPNVQRAGQYSVAVAPTPKTNSALQLAQALRVTPQILGQASNIAKGMGAEAAASANVEEAMLDPETKGILGYDKAHQFAIVKRYFAMNKDNIKGQFMDLAANPDELQKTPQEFLATLSEKRANFLEETTDKYGSNPNRADAITVLTNSFVDGVIGESMAEWDVNKKQQTEMFNSAEAQEMMNDPNQGMDKALKYLSTTFTQLGVSPKERGQKMRGSVIAAVAVHLESGNYNKAGTLLKQAQEYTLHGKAKLFGTAEGQKELAVLKAKIAKPQETLSKQITNSAKALNQQTSLFANIITHGTVEDQQAAFNNAFAQIGITSEKLDELGISLNTSSATESFRSLSLASQALLKSDQISDVQRGALMGIQSRIGSIDESGRFAKAPIGIAAEDDYSEFESTITKAINGNIHTDLGELVFRTDDGRVVPHTDTRIQTALQKAEKSRAFLDKEKHPNSAYFNQNSADLQEAVAKAVQGSKTKKYIQDSEYENEFVNLKRNAARETWAISSQLPTEEEQINDFNDKFPEKLRAISDELVDEIKERKKLTTNSADKIESLNQKKAVLDNADEISDDGKTFGYKFDSLSNEFYNEMIKTDPRTLLDTAQKDRDAIRAEAPIDVAPLLAAHYIRYGISALSEFTPESMKELRELGLGLADIRVGNEIRSELNTAITYYQKKAEGEKPSVAEENAMVKMRTVVGAYEVEDLQMIRTAIDIYDTQLTSFE